MHLAAACSKTLKVHRSINRWRSCALLHYSFSCKENADSSGTCPQCRLNTYLDMLQPYTVLQIEHLQLNIVLQQDAVSLYWALPVRSCLNEKFPARWIDRDGPLLWPQQLDIFCATKGARTEVL